MNRLLYILSFLCLFSCHSGNNDLLLEIYNSKHISEEAIENIARNSTDRCQRLIYYSVFFKNNFKNSFDSICTAIEFFEAYCRTLENKITKQVNDNERIPTINQNNTNKRLSKEIQKSLDSFLIVYFTVEKILIGNCCDSILKQESLLYLNNIHSLIDQSNRAKTLNSLLLLKQVHISLLHLQINLFNKFIEMTPENPAYNQIFTFVNMEKNHSKWVK